MSRYRATRFLSAGLGRHLDIDREREVSLGEPPRRMALLAGIGVVLGFVGGVAAFLIIRLVGLISNLALLGRVGFGLPNLEHYHPGPDLIGVCVGGAAVVSAMTLWAPTIRGHGIPEALEAILFEDSRIPPKVALAKPTSAAVTMGTGGPFGAEGPIIVTGGCVGSLIGQVLKLSPSERRIALATGAAAGMAGVFATPVAAIVLAFELLLFERSLRALLPLLLSTGVATELHYELIGSHPLFAAIGLRSVSGAELPLFIVLGIAAGAMALILNKGLFLFEAGFRRTGIPIFLHPILGAVGYAIIGYIYPGSLSLGYWAIRDAVNNEFLLGAAAILFVTKLFSWWIALASNTSGGTLAPIFIVGATMGEMIGIGFDHLFPALHIQPAVFAVVAMGATFGASARALLAGAVFALEVTGTYDLIVPMVITMAVAELFTHQFIGERLMTDKLIRRGFRVEFDAEVDPFRFGVVGDVAVPLPEGPLDPSLPHLDRTAFLRDATSLILTGAADSVIVESGGEPVGIIRRDVIDQALLKRLGASELQPPTLLRWITSPRDGRLAAIELTEDVGSDDGPLTIEISPIDAPAALETDAALETNAALSGDGNELT